MIVCSANADNNCGHRYVNSQLNSAAIFVTGTDSNCHCGCQNCANNVWKPSDVGKLHSKSAFGYLQLSNILSIFKT